MKLTNQEIDCFLYILLQRNPVVDISFDFNVAKIRHFNGDEKTFSVFDTPSYEYNEHSVVTVLADPDLVEYYEHRNEDTPIQEETVYHDFVQEVVDYDLYDVKFEPFEEEEKVLFDTSEIDQKLEHLEKSISEIVINPTQTIIQEIDLEEYTSKINLLKSEVLEYIDEHQAKTDLILNEYSNFANISNDRYSELRAHFDTKTSEISNVVKSQFETILKSIDEKLMANNVESTKTYTTKLEFSDHLKKVSTFSNVLQLFKTELETQKSFSEKINKDLSEVDLKFAHNLEAAIKSLEPPVSIVEIYSKNWDIFARFSDGKSIDISKAIFPAVHHYLTPFLNASSGSKGGNFVGGGAGGGTAGNPGKSAYELAVENGFDGTVEEWLASLSGGAAPIEDGVINYDGDGLIESIVTPSKTVLFLRNANTDIIGVDYGSYSKMFIRDVDGRILGWEIV